MNKEFVTYEQALALKELGFDEPCFGWYQDNTLRLDINSNQSIKFHEHLGRFKECFLAPLKQQVFRWFREKYGTYLSIEHSYYSKKWIAMYCNIDLTTTSSLFSKDTYEEAEDACINKLIELVKQKQ